MVRPASGERRSAWLMHWNRCELRCWGRCQRQSTDAEERLKAIDVIDVLSDLFTLCGIPGHIRFDNKPEFVSKAVHDWITAVGAKAAYIERGRPDVLGHAAHEHDVGHRAEGQAQLVSFGIWSERGAAVLNSALL